MADGPIEAKPLLAYLRSLCDPDDARSYIRAPWRLDAERVGAADGKVLAMLHAPGLDVGPDAPAPPDLTHTLSGAVTTTRTATLGAIRAWAGPIPAPVTCPACTGRRRARCDACDGTGRHACGDCDVVHDCGDCDGTGEGDCPDCSDGTVPAPPSPGLIGAAVADRGLVARVAAVPWPDATELRVETRGPHHAVTLTAPGGVLVVMPMGGADPVGERLGGWDV